jgi:cholesterol transport system auxiliary component
MNRIRVTASPAVAATTVALATACGGLLPKPAAAPTLYALEAPAARPAAPGASAALRMPLTIIVSPPRAAAGYDSARIVYQRAPHRLEHFAHNDWVDTPARMLAPLIVAALDASGAFRAVVSAPGPVAGELRLDTEILRLQQDFGAVPSQARLTLRATLVDSATRRVLAWREFDTAATSPSENPAGGVQAANRAVQAALGSMAGFCAETARSWPPPSPKP